MSEPKTTTLGRLRQELAVYANEPDDTPVFFGSGDLSLYRFKDRGGRSTLINIEFNEVYAVTLDPAQHL